MQTIPPHITLFEPTADFQWLITRHCSTFTPLTETTCTLLYWFCRWMLNDPSPYLDHLKSPCPEEMACAPWLMKNGLESLSVPLRQKSIYETLCLCVFVYHSVLLKVTREVRLPSPPSLHSSVHQCSPMGTGSIHIPAFGLTVSQRFAFWGVEESLTACSPSPSSPPHSLLLWIVMS